MPETPEFDAVVGERIAADDAWYQGLSGQHAHESRSDFQDHASDAMVEYSSDETSPALSEDAVPARDPLETYASGDGQVTVQYGMVKGLNMSGYSGIPSGMTVEDNLVLSAGLNDFVYAKATVTFPSTVTAVVIESASSVPVDVAATAESAGTYHQELARISDGVVAPIIKSSLFFTTACNGAGLWGT
jgi:hypothetical protein